MQLYIILVTHMKEWPLFPWLNPYASTHCRPQKPGQAYTVWQWADNPSDTTAIPAAGFDSATTFAIVLMLRDYLESTGPIFFSRKGQRKLLMAR